MRKVYRKGTSLLVLGFDISGGKLKNVTWLPEEDINTLLELFQEIKERNPNTRPGY